MIRKKITTNLRKLKNPSIKTLKKNLDLKINQKPTDKKILIKASKTSKNKRGPKIGYPNNKQINLIEIYCSMPDCEHSMYAAYMLAGYHGNQQKCLELFGLDKIKKAIEIRKDFVLRERTSKLRINELGVGGGSYKLDEERMKKIEELASLGFSNVKISKGVSVGESTFNKWLSTAKKAITDNDLDLDGEKGPYLAFYYRLMEARRTFEENVRRELIRRGLGYVERKNRIKKDSDDKVIEKEETKISKVETKTLIWLLERMDPETYNIDLIKEKILRADNGGKDPDQEAKEMLKAYAMLAQTIKGNPKITIEGDGNKNESQTSEMPT